MENKRFEFNKEQAYRLIAVTDKNSVDKVNSNKLYKSRINCIATNFCYDEHSFHEGKYRMQMIFIQTDSGLWCTRKLHTSLVSHVEEHENQIKIYTANSIYTFEKAVLNKIPYRDESNLIELYLSLEDSSYFGKGFYYDANKKPYELEKYVHYGRIQDSVLINCLSCEELQSETVCRYFPKGCIEFYDTLYGQQDYSTPMLIHNTGKEPLVVRFQFHPKEWTILSGESKYIIPFDSTEDAELKMQI